MLGQVGFSVGIYVGFYVGFSAGLYVVFALEAFKRLQTIASLIV